MPLQRKWVRDATTRWTRVKSLLKAGVSRFSDPVNTVAHAAITGDDPIRAFQAFVDESMRQMVLGTNGTWLLTYVRSASDAGVMHGRMLASTPAPRGSVNDRTHILQSMTISELQGVMEATSQQLVRAFANGLLTGKPASRIVADLNSIIDTIGVRRTKLLISFMTVRAFSAATLDAFRASGVSAVGTVPEKQKAPHLATDAPFPDTVNVLTAGDNDVCQECEDISDAGPYDIDDAEELIPAHPNCRCAFVPADDARFADPHDDIEDAEWDEDQHPRDPHGMFANVGGAPLTKYHPPDDWATVHGQNNKIKEPPIPNLMSTRINSKGVVVPMEVRLSSGVIMREPDGRTWLVKPSKGFGGYNHTFPKGGVEKGLSPQANAIKETYEETGLKARITGYAGDYHGDTGITRMYHAVREGGDPTDHGWETEKVVLAHPHEMNDLLNRTRDKKIALHHILKDDEGWSEELHPREPDGKFAFKGASVEHKVGELKTTLHLNGVNSNEVSHFEPGTYGAKETDNHHVFEVTNEASKVFTETAAKHGLQATEMPKLSGNTFKVYKAEHAAESSSTTSHGDLDMKDLRKVSGKKGSNEGGVYTSPNGNAYYIKNPATPDHVTNELMAAALYKLAGVRTMDYVPVKGGEHVATVLQPLEKDNIKKFTPAERTEAQKDFGVHAWLANWDAAGTGGDNQVVVNGHVHTVDTGGSLKYRAQGEPKGAAFGDKVTETNTLRDPSKNPDAANLYGPMTNEQLKASYEVVTNISNSEITNTILSNGGDTAMVDKMIARKKDLAAQADALTTKFTPAATLAEQTAATGAGFKQYGATPAAAKTTHDYLSQVKGTTAERVKWRSELKQTTDPQARKELQFKIVASFAKHHGLSSKDAAKQADLSAKAVKYSKLYKVDNPLTTPKPTAAPYTPDKPFVTAAGHDINTPIGAFKQSLDEHGVKYQATEGIHFIHVDVPHSDLAKAQEIAKWHPSVNPPTHGNIFVVEKSGTTTPKPAPKAAPTPTPTAAPTTYGKATEAELAKAAKTLPLQMQYVPGGVAGHPEAEKLLKAFNDKYAGKAMTTPDELQKKVDDFKQLSENMKPMQNEQQKIAAAAQAEAKAKAAAAQAKAKEAEAAALAASEKEAAAKAAAKLSEMNDPRVKAEYETLKAIANSHYDGSAYTSIIKKNKLKITPQEGGFLQAYIGSAYKHLNENLRMGKGMSVDQVKYANALDLALSKMPIHTGYTQRGIKHDPGGLIFQEYAKHVGSAVTELGFTSAGMKHKLWGETTIHIESKRGRDLSMFNSHEGGGEVVFRKGTHLHVIKVNPKTREVWAEEI